MNTFNRRPGISPNTVDLKSFWNQISSRTEFKTFYEINSERLCKKEYSSDTIIAPESYTKVFISTDNQSSNDNGSNIIIENVNVYGMESGVLITSEEDGYRLLIKFSEIRFIRSLCGSFIIQTDNLIITSTSNKTEEPGRNTLLELLSDELLIADSQSC